MSERVRAKLVEMLVQKKISLKEASIKMKVNYKPSKKDLQTILSRK